MRGHHGRACNGFIQPIGSDTDKSHLQNRHGLLPKSRFSALTLIYRFPGTNSVSERMMRSGFTVEPSGNPSPCTSIQIA